MGEDRGGSFVRGSHPGPRGHREQSHLPFRAYTSPSAGWGDTTYLTGCCEDSEGQCPGFGPEAGARGCRPGRQTVGNGACPPRAAACGFPLPCRTKEGYGAAGCAGAAAGTAAGHRARGREGGSPQRWHPGPSGQDTSGTGALRLPLKRGTGLTGTGFGVRPRAASPVASREPPRSSLPQGSRAPAVWGVAPAQLSRGGAPHPLPAPRLQRESESGEPPGLG